MTRRSPRDPKLVLWLGALVVGLSACGGAPVVARASTSPIRRTLIERRPATGLPGWQTSLYLIEYAPGAVAPVHTHPAVGAGYVLRGRFESAFGDEPVVEVKAGEGFVDQANVTHRVFRNPSADEELRFVIAYTLRDEDEPFRLGPATTELPIPGQVKEKRLVEGSGRARGELLVGADRVE